ncbi:MAG: hypothetical protein AB1758_37180 [Candidatus Eremiobacterota bacterium]
MPRWRVPFLVTILVLAPMLAARAQGPVDLRGDSGLLMELKPTGVVWYGPDQLLVCDERFNDFHIFDLQGRRFKLLEYPRNLPIACYSALTPLDDKVYLAAGSHYHDKNNVRYVNARAVIHRAAVSYESLDPSTGETNWSPDRALRTTGNFGESPRHQLYLQGLAIDPKQKRVFFGVSRPLTDQGTILIYEGKLDPFLARDKDFELKELKTDLKPALDPATGTPYHLADLTYVPGEGLLILLASQAPGGKSFGSSQLWMLRGGFAPPKLILKDIAPGNRGAGVAVRKEKDRLYTVAITFDNDPEETQIPSRLLILPGVKI